MIIKILDIVDTGVSLKESILARNTGFFDPFRYCSGDRSLEYLKAALVLKTNIFPFVCVLLH